MIEMIKSAMHLQCRDKEIEELFCKILSIVWIEFPGFCLSKDEQMPAIMKLGFIPFPLINDIWSFCTRQLWKHFSKSWNCSFCHDVFNSIQ